MTWKEAQELLRTQSKEAEKRYEDFIKAEQARADAEDTQKQRADAWKAMAERLAEELRGFNEVMIPDAGIKRALKDYDTLNKSDHGKS